MQTVLGRAMRDKDGSSSKETYDVSFDNATDPVRMMCVMHTEHVV